MKESASCWKPYVPNFAINKSCFSVSKASDKSININLPFITVLQTFKRAAKFACKVVNSYSQFQVEDSITDYSTKTEIKNE